MLPSADKEKTYRVDGGIAWYKSLLPAFDSQPLTTIINNLVSLKDGRAIKILDLGAGNFTFARECHQKWPQVQVTGVSKEDFTTPAEKDILKTLRVEMVFQPTSEAITTLPKDYDLVVSVLTNIYDYQTNYIQVMWEMLRDGGIGLLDNSLLPDSYKVDYELLEQKLREIGYEVYQLSKPLKTFPDMLTHPQTPLPITPVPATERNVYLEALKRLQTELSLPSQQVFMDHGIAFRKTSGLENLGEAIVKLLNNHSGLARG